MNQHELAEELYDNHRSDYGDGEYARGEAWDEAGEIIRRQNAHQDAWEDSRADSGDGETVSIWDNKWAPKPAEPSGGSGNVAIGVALGIVALGCGLYKWLFGQKEPPATTPANNSYTPTMERLVRESEENAAQILEHQKQTRTADEHDARLDGIAEIATRHECLIDALKNDINDHLEQPGSVFYMSTEYPLSALDDHFKRFKDPDDIDKFIRGEERVKVLEMAELYKVLLAD